MYAYILNCRETKVWSLGCEDPLEKEIANYSSILAWQIPWTEEPGRLQSMGSHQVGYHLMTKSHRLLHKNHCVSFFFFLFLLVGGQSPYSIVVGFVIHWHESAMELHVFPIPIPPLTSLSTRSFWVFPVHQARALVSCIQPGLVICFTLDNIHVSVLFSRNIPPLPSPTKSKSLFCFLRYILGILTSFIFLLSSYLIIKFGYFTVNLLMCGDMCDETATTVCCHMSFISYVLVIYLHVPGQIGIPRKDISPSDFP